MPTLAELRAKLSETQNEAHRLINHSFAPDEEIPEDYHDQITRCSDRLDELRAEIKQLETRENAERLRESLREKIANESRGRKTSVGDLKNDDSGDEYRHLFGQYLLGQADYREVSAVMPKSMRDVVQSIPKSGGYLMAPGVSRDLFIKAVNSTTFIRGAARVISGLKPLRQTPIVGLAQDVSDHQWTSELTTGDKDTSFELNLRSIQPYPLMKRILLSTILDENTDDTESAVSVEDLIMEGIGYKAATTQENAFLTGHGSSQPLGLFRASTQGIPTSRDVATGNTSSAITADGLINALYSLKSQYMSRATWIFHRTVIAEIRKLKHVTDGTYIWAPGLNGAEGTILGRPFFMSEFAPNTMTTGSYVGLIGDLSQYIIGESGVMTVQRLVEKYAESNMVAFIARSYVDGMPALAEAFARVTLA